MLKLNILKLKKKPLFIILICLIIIAVVFGIVILTKQKPEAEKTLPEESYGLSGTIKALEGNSFTIDAIIIFTDGTNQIESKKILTDENTKINKLEFPKISAENRTKPIEPRKTEIKFSDLKVGDKIDATSKENVQGKNEFLAKIINVIVIK